jgi:conjugative transfer signal peptidase TraF
VLAIGLLAIAAPRAGHPHLVWNASDSVPIGLYRLVQRAPLVGDLAIVRLPVAVRALARARGYLGADALLLKPVAAGPGDIVCRHGMTVSINGIIAARARDADAPGRPLPRWNGCVTLAEGQVFLLAAVPDSFDSRYFGPVDRTHVLGSGHPLWLGRSRAPVYLRLLEPFDHAVHLHKGVGKLRPERGQVGDRIVLPRQAGRIE